MARRVEQVKREPLMLEAHHHEETEMPRSTAIQSERARRCSPRASTSPASFNRHSPDSRPVGPDFPSLDVPPQRNSIAIDPIGSQTAGLLTPDLRTCPVFVIEAHLCRRVLGQALDQSLDFPRREGIREGAALPPLARLLPGRQAPTHTHPLSPRGIGSSNLAYVGPWRILITGSAPLSLPA